MNSNGGGVGPLDYAMQAGIAAFAAFIGLITGAKVQEAKIDQFEKRLDRIEDKLDRLLEREH